MELEAVFVEYDGSLRFEDLGVLVRFVEATHAGRFEPIGVELLNEVLTLRALREIPFGRIEAVANTSLVAQLIRERLYGPGDHFNVWVDLKEQVAYAGKGDIEYRLAGDPDAPLVVIDKRTRSRDQAEALVKEIIDDKPTRYGDEFYQLVARLYEWETMRSKRPGAVLAEQLDVPIGRVWRWVRVCRTKGYLAPSRSGREES